MFDNLAPFAVGAVYVTGNAAIVGFAFGGFTLSDLRDVCRWAWRHLERRMRREKGSVH